MYELNLAGQARDDFKALAKKKMRAKGWTMKILAAEIHRTPGSVYSFFAHNSKPQRFIAAEIATVLEIKRSDF